MIKNINKHLLLALIIFALCGAFYPYTSYIIGNLGLNLSKKHEIISPLDNQMHGYKHIAQKEESQTSHKLFSFDKTSHKSNSALDPNISLADAYAQIEAISSTIGVKSITLKNLVDNLSYKSMLDDKEIVNVNALNYHLQYRADELK